MRIIFEISSWKSIKSRLNSSYIAPDALWQLDLSITLWKWYASASLDLVQFVHAHDSRFLSCKEKKEQKTKRKMNKSRDFEVDDGPLWIKNEKYTAQPLETLQSFQVQFNYLFYFMHFVEAWRSRLKIKCFHFIKTFFIPSFYFDSLISEIFIFFNWMIGNILFSLISLRGKLNEYFEAIYKFSSLSRALLSCFLNEQFWFISSLFVCDVSCCCWARANRKGETLDSTLKAIQNSL